MDYNWDFIKEGQIIPSSRGNLFGEIRKVEKEHLEILFSGWYSTANEAKKGTDPSWKRIDYFSFLTIEKIIEKKPFIKYKFSIMKIFWNIIKIGIGIQLVWWLFSGTIKSILMLFYH